MREVFIIHCEEASYSMREIASADRR